jgi:hypothetical protein
MDRVKIVAFKPANHFLVEKSPFSCSGFNHSWTDCSATHRSQGSPPDGDCQAIQIQGPFSRLFMEKDTGILERGKAIRSILQSGDMKNLM